ncbi:MAG: hypothetical protein M1825_003477 [Sarcosagium campestre]|nr:MAG: hypothetical protein M1825_003477 [Sarcosagium campestre]
MTRPQIVRADTIDLQDQDNPSAKDHSRQRSHPGSAGEGAVAPHQARTLKAAEDESVEEQQTSPRVSWINGDGATSEGHFTDANKSLSNGASGHDQDLGESMVKRNGSLNSSSGDEDDMADAEGDDGLDDDMMDKISSSPSIDDGGYCLPLRWPTRLDSLPSSTHRSSTPIPSSPSILSTESSSPYLSAPIHFPISSAHQARDGSQREHHQHHLGGYPGDRPCDRDTSIPGTESDVVEDEAGDRLTPLLSELASDCDVDNFNFGDLQESLDGDAPDVRNILLPIEDPFLDEKLDALSEVVPPLRSYVDRWANFQDGYDSEDDDSADDFSLPTCSCSDLTPCGHCLHETEDIDFDFVYALHTFVATVEGQANATKGDTMVLLDDSNSYWWLVRVVKDSSIGYLPAEHIETPTERLARLNKHRNIDLSQTMLGDNHEKSKNPLKKAMRRRNAKTVQFSAPTYVEASDIDYSSEEGEADGEPDGNEVEAEPVAHAPDEQDEITAIEPLKPKNPGKDPKTDLRESSDVTRDSIETDARSDRTHSLDESEEGLEGSHKSRNGTVRNTDSFFKDDSVETRKITLTPNLLRDDSASSLKSIDSRDKELKSRGSMESMEKAASVSEKTKDDKRRKEKKSGMLSGLFKRKDRKSKTTEDEIDDLLSSEKLSEESSRASPIQKVSEESFRSEARASPQPGGQPQRQPSKLQKAAPTDKPAQRDQQIGNSTEQLDRSSPQLSAPDRSASSAILKAPAVRSIEAESERRDSATPEPLRVRTPEQSRKGRTPTPELKREPKDASRENGGKMFPITSMLKSSTGSKSSVHSNDAKPEKVKKAKKRLELDDFDSSQEDDRSPLDPSEAAPGRQSAGDRAERLSESPVQVSPVDAPTPHPPGLFVDSSSQETPTSPVSPPSSPEMVDAPEVSSGAQDDYEGRERAMTSSSTRTTPTWSDASLRTYLEDDNDIRDLLIVVHDKTGVEPAGPDHPFVGRLFKEENAKLAEITTVSQPSTLQSGSELT